MRHPPHGLRSQVMIEVSELFYSLQGEGPFAGKPAVFLRLSRCLPPLCPWCDTTFAWQPGTLYQLDDTVEKILDYGCNFVVITGGEPFLQWSTGLQQLETSLHKRGCVIQYETSGKVPLPIDSKGFIVCSPKYLDSKWHFSEANSGVVDAYKFVTKDEFKIVDNFIEKWQIPAEKIWIMPRGACREDQLANMENIWQYCVERGFNFSPRLHTLVFDNKKGV